MFYRVFKLGVLGLFLGSALAAAEPSSSSSSIPSQGPIPGVDFSKPGPVPAPDPSSSPLPLSAPRRRRGRGAQSSGPNGAGGPDVGFGVDGGNYSGSNLSGLSKVKIGF